MPISAATLETAIRAAIPVTHLDIEDTSNGCGENYAVFVVSEVRAQPFAARGLERRMWLNGTMCSAYHAGVRGEEHAREAPLQ